MMKNTMTNKTILAAVIIISLFCILCVSPPQKPTPQTTSTLAATTPTTIIEVELSDIQVDACNAADKAGTCHTKLHELGIVAPEDCCKYLKKCCVESVLI